MRGDHSFGLLQVPAFDPTNMALRRSQKQKEIHQTPANVILSWPGSMR